MTLKVLLSCLYVNKRETTIYHIWKPKVLFRHLPYLHRVFIEQIFKMICLRNFRFTFESLCHHKYSSELASTSSIYILKSLFISAITMRNSTCLVPMELETLRNVRRIQRKYTCFLTVKYRIWSTMITEASISGLRCLYKS